MKKATIQEFFNRLAQANPSPGTELIYASPFQLLVAVVLSAQTTDKQVNVVTRTLFQLAPDAQAIVNLGVERVTDIIQKIGLFRNKAKNVVALSHILLEHYGGEVPHDRVALEALPGVGRKTANVILNTIFHEPVIAVDTHIFRLANRTGLAKGKNVTEVEKTLTRIIPDRYKLHAHHWLILHGRYVCKAKKPLCPQCIVRDLCLFPEKTQTSQ